jgi:hypothetical protein
MHTPEWHEKQKIKKYLNDLCVWYFCPFMAGRGKAGVPDIIACFNGRFVAIEVKRPGKKPTPLQIRRLLEIERAGGFALWGDAATVIHRMHIFL